MWRFLIICLFFASSTGIVLNLLSNSIEEKQKFIAHLESDLEHQKERMKILNAEWAFVTSPKKIASLASTNLNMSNVKYNQIIEIDSLSIRSSAWKMQEGATSKSIVSASVIKIQNKEN
tara:strand:- start:627 stop:983 length:357 start_codon:yes stop_codon:yes gene_type:complete